MLLVRNEVSNYRGLSKGEQGRWTDGSIHSSLASIHCTTTGKSVRTPHLLGFPTTSGYITMSPFQRVKISSCARPTEA
jgi:hypothetical protein